MYRLLIHAAVCISYLSASLLFFAPPHHWSGLSFFGYGQDPLSFIWFLNWWPYALTHHLPLLTTRYVDYPAGSDLVWKTSVPALGLLLAPLTLRVGAVAVFNALMVIGPGLAAFGAYLAAFELTRARTPAISAGVIFGASSYEIGQSQGHLNLAFTIAVPLSLWVMARAIRHDWPRAGLALAMGTVLLFEFGVSQEIFASLVLLGGLSVLILYFTVPGLQARIVGVLLPLVIGLALSVIAASPFIWQMLRLYGADNHNLSPPDSYGNDLLAFFVPTPLALLGGLSAVPVTKHFLGSYTEQGGYFGLPLVMLLSYIAVRGSRAERAVGGIALLAAVLSLGPFMHILGVRVSTAPWIIFYKLPLLSGILPCRLAMYAWLAAAILVALWLAAPGQPARRYAMLSVCMIPVVPAQSFDRHWTHLAVPRVFASVPNTAHVLVLPEFGQELGWQEASNMRFELVGQGYLGTGRPTPFDRWRLFEPLWENRFADINPAQFSTYLSYYSVQYVIVLPDGYNFYGGRIDESVAAVAADQLVKAAGWQRTIDLPDGQLFKPGDHPQNWRAAQIVGDQISTQAGVTSAHRAKLAKQERKNVCIIRWIGRAFGVNPKPILLLYNRFWALPQPPDDVRCTTP